MALNFCFSKSIPEPVSGFELDELDYLTEFIILAADLALVSIFMFQNLRLLLMKDNSSSGGKICIRAFRVAA